MKNIINKIFPREQKFLNFMKFLYIFIFIISIPEMFERFGSADLTNTFGKTVAMLLFIIISLVSLMIIIFQYLSKNENKFVTNSILAIQIFLYLFVAKLNNYASGLIHPFLIFPLLITFAYINKKSHNFSRNLVIFLFIPFFIVGFDEILSLNFQVNCRNETPRAEYSPMYLDKKFFHEESINGFSSFIPNIKEVYGIRKADSEILLETENNIILLHKCFWEKDGFADKLIKKGNVVLCMEENKNIKNNEKFSNSMITSDVTIKILQEDKSFIHIAKFYYMEHKKNYLKLYFLGYNTSNCKYNNIFTPNNYFKYTYNYWSQFRKKELSYDNYIKPIQ